MAKDEKNTEETAEEKTEGAAPEKKSGKMKWIIIGVVVLVLLGGGGFAAWKFLSTGSGEPEAMAKPGGHEGALPAPGPIVALDSFLVNLADPADSHYLKVTVNLEVEKPESTEEIQQRMPQIRDSILVLLSSKTAEDVRSVEGKFRLRDEIIGRVNKFISHGKIKGAYFTEFVMQ